MTAILGFLTSLPQILSLIQTIWSYIEKVSGNDPQGFIIRLNEAFANLHIAKSEDDYAKIAKDLQKLIRG